MWRLIKVWLDPVTASKIVFLSPDEALPTMEKYIDIENIPKSFGGRLELEWRVEPNLDPVIKESLTWLPAGDGSVPKGPMKWVDGGNGSKVAVAVGKEGGKVRYDQIASLNA